MTITITSKWLDTGLTNYQKYQKIDTKETTVRKIIERFVELAGLHSQKSLRDIENTGLGKIATKGALETPYTIEIKESGAINNLEALSAYYDGIWEYERILGLMLYYIQAYNAGVLDIYKY